MSKGAATISFTALIVGGTIQIENKLKEISNQLINFQQIIHNWKIGNFFFNIKTVESVEIVEVDVKLPQAQIQLLEAQTSG